MTKAVLISDFDGTISGEDFFGMVIERLLTKEDIKPWDDYVAGKITHFEALNKIFTKVAITQKKLDAFIQSIKIDEKISRRVKALRPPWRSRLYLQRGNGLLYIQTHSRIY